MEWSGWYAGAGKTRGNRQMRHERGGGGDKKHGEPRKGGPTRLQRPRWRRVASRGYTGGCAACEIKSVGKRSNAGKYSQKGGW